MALDTIVRQKDYYPALTGLRALAAALVVFFHYGEMHLSKSPNWAEMVVASGHLGVSIFFALSGFLITLVYARRRHDISVQHFFQRRVARIFPAYLFVLGLVYIKALSAGKSPGVTQVLLNTTLLQGYSPEYLLSGLGVAWTLTVEEAFYFSTPVIVAVCMPKLDTWRALLLRMLFIGSGFAFIAVLAMLLNLYGMNADETARFLVVRTIFGRIWEFLFGVLAAFIYMRYQPSQAKGGNIQALMVCIGLGLVPVLLEYSRNPLTNWAAKPLVAALSAILIYQFVTRQNMVSSFFSSAPLVYLGKISYALYLIHEVIQPELSKLYATIGLFPGNVWVICLFAYCISNLAAACIYHVIEVPCQRWINGLGSKA